jgi:hypothetical protein
VRSGASGETSLISMSLSSFEKPPASGSPASSTVSLSMSSDTLCLLFSSSL